MNNPSNERRSHFRVYRNFILSYHEKGKSIIKHNVSQVNNVSKGGLSFISTYPLKEGAVLTVDLKAPFIGNPIRLEGEVLESREKIPDLIYEIRLQFHEIHPQVLIVLEKIERYAKAKED
jgi:hypothetical protein